MKPSQALTKTYTINAQNEEKGGKGGGGGGNDDEQHSAVFRASETVKTTTRH